MSPRDLGPHYPRYLGTGRTRKPLIGEHRWSRSFGTREDTTIVSRFEDGSASATYDDVASGWATWTEFDRLDFCQYCSWLQGQGDFPDILRFIAAHGVPSEWGAVASLVARSLPAEEAFAMLEKMFEASVVGTRTNLVQAVGLVEHTKSLALVVADVRALEPLEATWHPEDVVNGHASELICAVHAALKLGASPADYTDLVRRLASHPSPANAAAARRQLGATYPEILAPAKVDGGVELPPNVLPFRPRRR